MNTLKHNNMMKVYTGFRGDQTIDHIHKFIPKELFEKCTGAELGEIMNAVNNAYNEGKESTGANVYDNSPTDGAVWVNCINTSIEWKKNGDILTTNIVK